MKHPRGGNVALPERLQRCVEFCFDSPGLMVASGSAQKKSAANNAAPLGFSCVRIKK
jgi:hypothetical protein